MNHRKSVASNSGPNVRKALKRYSAPVSPFTVMKELGHSSLKIIKEVYGHIQDQRHRSDVVEYREASVLPIKVAR